MTIRWNLKVMMAVRDMGNEELAKAAKLHPGTIAKLRSSNPKQINFTTLDSLCKALGCTPGDLIYFDNDNAA